MYPQVIIVVIVLQMDTVRSNEMQRIIESWFKSDEVSQCLIIIIPKTTQSSLQFYVTHYSTADPEKVGQPRAGPVGRSGGTEL